MKPSEQRKWYVVQLGLLVVILATLVLMRV